MQTDLSHSQLQASLFIGMTSYLKDIKLHKNLTDEKADTQKNLFVGFSFPIGDIPDIRIIES